MFKINKQPGQIITQYGLQNEKTGEVLVSFKPTPEQMDRKWNGKPNAPELKQPAKQPVQQPVKDEPVEQPVKDEQPAPAPKRKGKK